MASKAQLFVSRQSMKNNQFEIFHYCDTEPKNVGIHHHDFFEIYFFLRGNVSYNIEGRIYALQPGDIVLISPQELHQAQVAPGTEYERIVLWINCNYLATLQKETGELSRCFERSPGSRINLLRPDQVQQAALRELLEKLGGEFYGTGAGSQLYAQGLLLQFLVEVNRLAQNAADHVPHSGEKQLIQNVLAYISEHYRENITLEDLSSHFFVSKYHLSHEFRNQVGTSVYRYVIFRRLMLAKQLMEAGSQPGTVYQSCGFGDYANFYRAFKGEYGISPREFAAFSREK